MQLVKETSLRKNIPGNIPRKWGDLPAGTFPWLPEKGAHDSLPTTFLMEVTHPPTPSQTAPRAASPAPSSLPGPRLLLNELLTRKTKRRHKEEMTSTHAGRCSFGGFTNRPSWVSLSSQLVHASSGTTRGTRHGGLTTHAQMSGAQCPALVIVKK